MSLCVNLIAVLLVFAGVWSETHGACNDIDASACALMLQQRPELCTDPLLSQTACPRFCKQCPVECYHCNGTSSDFNECNTTLLCDQGEVCMRMELRSTFDGHHEYKLSCQNKQFCDSAGLINAIGRRDIESRDVDLRCCDTDLCNLPQLTTPTQPTGVSGCRKDVFVIVDDKLHREEVHDANAINTFLLDVVKTISPIGQTGSLMSVATFSRISKPLWNLTTYTDATSLNNAINGVQFMQEHHDDLEIALSYLISQKSSPDNRADADDVAIILSSNDADNDTHAAKLASQLHHLYSNVIAIGFTHSIDDDDLEKIATDHGHQFSINHIRVLPTVAKSILPLICA